MFQISRTDSSDGNSKERYKKSLGWKEMDSDGDIYAAGIIVLDVMYGYNVLRFGKELTLLHWNHKLDAAVEFAVDQARKEIAEHELQCEKRAATLETSDA